VKKRQGRKVDRLKMEKRGGKAPFKTRATNIFQIKRGLKKKGRKRRAAAKLCPDRFNGPRKTLFQEIKTNPPLPRQGKKVGGGFPLKPRKKENPSGTLFVSKGGIQ